MITLEAFSGTVAQFMSNIGTILTGAFDWVTDIGQYIYNSATANPIVFVSFGAGLALYGIHLLKSLKNS